MFDRRIRDNRNYISTAAQRLIQQTLTPFHISDQLFMKSSTIYSSLKALFNLIFLLRLTSPHQISVTSAKLCQKAILEEDYASMYYSTWTRTQFHLLASTSMSSGRLSACKSITNSLAQLEKRSKSLTAWIPYLRPPLYGA